MKHPRTYLALISAFLWGLSYPLTKMNQTAFAVSGAGSLMLVAGIRFVISGGVLILWNLARHRKDPAIPAVPSRVNVKNVLILGLLMTALQYLFMYTGLELCTGSKSSILKQTSVPLVVFLSGLIFPDDKLTWRKLAGVAMGFASVIVCSMPLSAFDFVPAGDIPVLLAAMSAGFADLYAGRATKACDPIFLSGWQQFFGGSVLLLGGMLCGGHIGAVTAGSIFVLLAVCAASIVASTLYLWLTRYCPVSKLSLYKLTIPIFSVLTSGLLLGEDFLKPQYWAAIALVSAGVVVANSKKKA